MNGMRKVFGYLLNAVMLAAFALSSGAAFGADKTYTLTMSPVTGTSPTAMTALFTNKGNSSFNSLQLTVPVGYTLGATPTASRGQVSVSGQVITVKNINLPTGSGQTMSVTMPVVSATAATCSSGVAGGWTAVLWTGSTLSGNNFGQVGPSTTSTTIGALCFTVSGVGLVAGGGTVTCASPVAAGGSSLCTATLNDKYSFNGFTTDTNSCTGTGSSCTVSNVQANTTVTGNYTKNELSVTGPGTTVAAGAPFNITVGLSPPPTSVDVSVSGSGCVLTAPTGSVNVTTSPATISVTIQPINPPGNQNCTINVSAANYFETSLQLSSVYGGVLGCTGGTTSGVYDNYNSSNGASNFSFDPDNTITPQSDGWGLRRGANYAGADCIKVAYTFTPPTTANGNLASMLYDRTTGQSASWKYLVTWPNIDVDSSGPNKGWTTFRPWLSWGIDSPSTAANSPDFVPALFCLNDPGDLAERTKAQLLALQPTMPDDCAVAGTSGNGTGDGPFCKAAFAHPSVYALGGKAKMCVSEQGLLTDPNKLFPWTEIVDQADGYAKLPTQ